MNKSVKRPIQRPKRKVRKSFVAVMLIFIIALLAILSVTVFFPVNKVSVKAPKNTAYTSEQIIKASGIEAGDNLIVLSSDEIEANITEALPYIGSVEVDKSLGGEILLNIRNASEKYCIKAKDTYYITDESNKVLAFSDKKKSSLINISGAAVNKTAPGEILEFKNSEKKEAIEDIIETVGKAEIKLNSINVSNLSVIALKIEDIYTVELGSISSLKEKTDGLLKAINEHIKSGNSEKGKFITVGDDWIFNPDD